MLGEYSAAECAYRESVAVYEKVAETISAEPAIRERLAISRLNLAWLLKRCDRLPESKALATQVLQQLTELTAGQPEVLRHLENWATGFGLYGAILTLEGDPKAAEYFAKAFDEGFVLLGQTPYFDRPSLQEQFAVSLRDRSLTFELGGQFDMAERLLVESQSVLHQLSRTWPNNPSYRNELAQTSYQMGRVAGRGSCGKGETAHAAFLEARGLWRELYQRGCPPEYRCDYLEFLILCPDSSFRDASLSRTIAEEICNGSPDNVNYRSKLGAAYCRTGEWQKAEKTLRECLLARPNGRDAFLLAIAQIRLGQDEEAAVSRRIGEVWLEQVTPGDWRLQTLQQEVNGMISREADLPEASRD